MRVRRQTCPRSCYNLLPQELRLTGFPHGESVDAHLVQGIAKNPARGRCTVGAPLPVISALGGCDGPTRQCVQGSIAARTAAIPSIAAVRSSNSGGAECRFERAHRISGCARSLIHGGRICDDRAPMGNHPVRPLPPGGLGRPESGSAVAGGPTLPEMWVRSSRHSRPLPRMRYREETAPSRKLNSRPQAVQFERSATGPSASSSALSAPQRPYLFLMASGNSPLPPFPSDFRSSDSSPETPSSHPQYESTPVATCSAVDTGTSFAP